MTIHDLIQDAAQAPYITSGLDGATDTDRAVGRPVGLTGAT